MSATAHHHEPGLAGVEVFAELLEIVPAHAGRRMTGNCAEDRPTGCGPCQQPSPYTPT
jgi:hypothetical protein